MKNNKIFNLTLLAYFISMGVLHFIRLALDWRIIIVTSQKDYTVSTLISALCFLFSSFMVYWIYKQKKINKKIEVKNIEKKED